MIIKIIRFIRHKLRWQKWRRQLRNLPGNTIRIEVNRKYCTAEVPILVIAPHADDELIGCHQLIKNNPKDTTVLYCGYLGSNPTEDNRRVREKEIKNYTANQGCRLFESSPPRIENDLKNLIKEIRPATIFVPSFVDWHDEHRLVNIILRSALNDIDYQGKIGWYHVSLPIPANIVNSVSVMTEREHSEKWLTMRKCYPSQLHMDIKRFQFVERQARSSYYAAETYVIQTVEEWMHSIEELQAVEETMNEMKACLGDIYVMYNKTIEYYKFL